MHSSSSATALRIASSYLKHKMQQQKNSDQELREGCHIMIKNSATGSQIMMYESFVPKKGDMDGNQVRLLSCGFLPTSSPCAGVFPVSLAGFVPRLASCVSWCCCSESGDYCMNLWEFGAASACVTFHVFLSSLRPPQDKMHRQLFLTVGLCTLCQKSKLQQYNRFFFVGS